MESSPQGDRPVVSLPYQEPVTGRIFVSYRREDAGGHVLALTPWLADHFGHERIFKDTDSIGVGHDFIDTIRRELESCSVVLVVIGHEWLTVLDQRLGAPRLQAPDDVVHLEVATALKAQVPVIPVLVARATMPAAEDLPPELRPLARINAIELSDARWKADVLQLIGAIEQASGGRRRWRSATLFLKRLFHEKAWLVSTVLALAVVLGASRFFVPAGQLQSNTGGTPSPPSVATRDASGTAGSIESAWLHYNNGARVEALDTALQGLSKNPADASLKAAAAARRVAKRPPLASDGLRAGVSEPPPALLETEIAGVLERFRLAYNARDLEAIRQVYPQVRKDLEKTFRNCRQVTLTFGPLGITPLPNGRVQVEMESTESCQPNTGQRRLRDQVVTNKFQLERRGTSWIIVEQLVPL